MFVAQNSLSSTASSPFLSNDSQTSSQSLNPVYNLPPAPPASSTSLSSANTNDNLNYMLSPRSHGSMYNSAVSTNVSIDQVKRGLNEPPPAYESLLIKSSSLPSYCNLTETIEKLNDSQKKIENGDEK